MTVIKPMTKRDHMLLGFLIGVITMQAGGFLLSGPYQPPNPNGAEAIIERQMQGLVVEPAGDPPVVICEEWKP